MLGGIHSNRFRPMLNRNLLIVRPKQPFVDWINEADPYPDGGHITLEYAIEDCPAFLVHDSACEDLEGWLEQCYLPLFEEILEFWYTDPALWPQDRTLELFKTWIDVDVRGIILDVVDEPLLDDEIEEASKRPGNLH